MPVYAGREVSGKSLFTVFGQPMALLALLLAAVGVFLPSGGGTDTAGGASAAPLAVTVVLTEFKIEPSSVELQPGQDLVITVQNKGTMAHDLKLGGTEGTKMLDPGGSETITLTGIDADAQAWCTVAGHKEAGMVMDI